MPVDLRNILNNTTLTRKDKILILLIYNESIPKKVSEIKSLGKSNGLREIEKWNVPAILSSLRGLAIKLPEGWTITSEGKNLLIKKGFKVSSPVVNPQSNLVDQANKITSPYVKEFVLEAINSLEYRLLKSAVVFSWVGAISLLYDYVEKKHLSAFNQEAKRRFPKWKDAKNIDGLTKMKEYDFLQVLEGISMIGNSTKNELEQCLKLRNSCGHPSTLKIGENKVAAHIEILILNVFLKFT